MQSCGWRRRARPGRACLSHSAPIAAWPRICVPPAMPRSPLWRPLPTTPPKPTGSVAPISCAPDKPRFSPRAEHMANVAVIGAQWGDEGKGKVVDWLASRADVVVRFQGGHNAGHTLVVGNQTYKLSLLPSG